LEWSNFGFVLLVLSNKKMPKKEFGLSVWAPGWRIKISLE